MTTIDHLIAAHWHLHKLTLRSTPVLTELQWNDDWTKLYFRRPVGLAA